VETWLGCHRRAFEHFGGTTLKTVIDNPKCAITRACYYEPEVQRAYAEFAEGYSFLISACPPRDPQKKGVVESGVKYVKNSFQPLREFRDLADANRQLHEWVMGRAGNRIHGTTKQKPLVRFAEMEKDFLRPLPDIPPELACWASVKLHGNCHVQFEKAFYSAPFTLVHKSLWLRATEKTVQIFHEQQLVATHPRLSQARRTEHGAGPFAPGSHGLPDARSAVVPDPGRQSRRALPGAGRRPLYPPRPRQPACRSRSAATPGVVTANDDWRRPAPEPWITGPERIAT
jgi:hypothetical protein